MASIDFMRLYFLTSGGRATLRIVENTKAHSERGKDRFPAERAVGGTETK